jgi:hypothetical protein
VIPGGFSNETGARPFYSKKKPCCRRFERVTVSSEFQTVEPVQGTQRTQLETPCRDRHRSGSGVAAPRQRQETRTMESWRSGRLKDSEVTDAQAGQGRRLELCMRGIVPPASKPDEVIVSSSARRRGGASTRRPGQTIASSYARGVWSRRRGGANTRRPGRPKSSHGAMHAEHHHGMAARAHSVQGSRPAEVVVSSYTRGASPAFQHTAAPPTSRHGRRRRLLPSSRTASTRVRSASPANYLSRLLPLAILA